MDHPLLFSIITEDTTRAMRRYSLSGDITPFTPPFEAVIAHTQRISIHPPDAKCAKVLIQLKLYYTANLKSEYREMTSLVRAYGLPNGRHLFLVEKEGTESGLLFDIVNKVSFPGLSFTTQDLLDLLDHPSGTVRTFAHTNLMLLAQ